MLVKAENCDGNGSHNVTTSFLSRSPFDIPFELAVQAGRLKLRLKMISND